MEQQFKALKHKNIENKWIGGGESWNGTFLNHTQSYPHLYPITTTDDDFYDSVEDYDLITITINY